MSKLVCHMGKYVRSNVFGLQKHNQRENKNYSNDNVDLKQTHLNYDLANENSIRYLQKIDDVISKNRTNTDRGVRKDAIVFVDTVVSSDKEFFRNLSEEDTKRFFKESFKYLQHKVGKDNVISANVHMDENTPHMHFSFVPINSDGSLSAKKKVNREFLRKIQDEFPRYLSRNCGFDIERGMEKSTKKHMEPLEFKKDQIKNDTVELEKLSKETMAKFQDLYNTSEDVSKLENHFNSVIGRLDKIEAKKGLFSDKLTISREDYSILIQLAKQGESKLIENYKLKSSIGNLKSKVNSEKFDNESLKIRLEAKEDVEYENSMLRSENKKLKTKFNAVEKAVNNLDLTDVINKELNRVRENTMAQRKRKSHDYEMER